MHHTKLFKAILSPLSPGHVVIDVGAHRGNYARVFSKIVRGKGKIFSFEPHPEKFIDLKRMAKITFFKNISPHCLAISDKIGTAILHYGKDIRADEASTICPDLANEDRLGSEIQQIEVSTITLDSFCNDSGIKPNFIKIDVEGAEDKVIFGMSGIIQEYKPIIMFECGLHKELPCYFSTLREQGYSMWIIDIARFFPPDYSGKNVKDSSSKKLNSKIYTFKDEDLLSSLPALINVLCIHRDKADNLIPQDNVIPLEFALQYLSQPSHSFRSLVVKYLPKRIVQVLRMIRNSWVY